MTNLLAKCHALLLAGATAGMISAPALAGQTLEPLLDPSPALQASGDAAPQSPRFVLQGSVTTIQEAIAEEKNIDWYQWYMGARNYLFRTGGVPCDLGTDIKFHKEGRIEALNSSVMCARSLAWRHFPLPKDTQLDAVILPVRSGQAPPASREEIYNRVKGADD